MLRRRNTSQTPKAMCQGHLSEGMMGPAWGAHTGAAVLEDMLRVQM